MAGFWAAAAYAEVRLSSPVQDLGIIKGYLMRHLRWWASKPDIFHADGTLNIGYAYPNMYMCEDYNSPQSVYWCMKSFCCLGLSSSHPFWTAQEQTYPRAAVELSYVVKPSMQIVCHSDSHHFLLSSGQFCPWPLKATEAKYGKLAYSSHFGFSVPTGPLIEQIAPDSTLAFRLQDDDAWKVRWISDGAKFSTAQLHTSTGKEQVPVLVSRWRPWKLHDVEVNTALIAPTARWPEWHVRIHRIDVKSGAVPCAIEAVEGGFAIHGRTVKGGLPIYSQPVEFQNHVGGLGGIPEIATTSEDSCLVASSQGMSGIRMLRPEYGDTALGLCKSQGHLLKPDANTNLMQSRTVIPTIKSILQCNVHDQRKTFYLTTGVFATGTAAAENFQLWNDSPQLKLSPAFDNPGQDCISFSGW